MLKPRIIPCLLVSSNGLVKTLKFKERKYVGDPINAIRIFNEKEADELIVLDIDATRENREPDYKRIEFWAAECRMPLCYGGGIRNVEQAKKIFALGVEKIALSSSALADPKIITSIANRVGNQSVVIVLDVKKGNNGSYEVFTLNGSRRTGKDPVEMAMVAEKSGAGEIVVNSIDRDGLMKGYDYELVDKVRANVTLPITALGGAGSLNDISNLFERYTIIGAGVGSLFVFKGKYRAVLINYPDPEVKERLYKHALTNPEF